MCGGIGFSAKRVSRADLERYYDEAKIAEFEKDGVVESYFWDPIPVLPVEKDGEVVLKLWGNRSDDLHLPKTGWAKKESIDEGKWAKLNPKIVKIPADKGYEKGVWFNVKSGHILGVEIEKDGEDRVYMMTKPASEDYVKLTKHVRQPVEE